MINSCYEFCFSIEVPEGWMGEQCIVTRVGCINLTFPMSVTISKPWAMVLAPFSSSSVKRIFHSPGLLSTLSVMVAIYPLNVWNQHLHLFWKVCWRGSWDLALKFCLYVLALVAFLSPWNRGIRRACSRKQLSRSVFENSEGQNPFPPVRKNP